MNIDSFVSSVCAAMIIGGIVCLIRPSTSQQNIIKTVTALFIICICFSPVLSLEKISEFDKFSFTKELKSNTRLEDYINDEFITENQRQYAISFGEILSARGIYNYRIEFELNDNYEISCANIYTKQSDANLEEYLESKFNIDVNIIEE